LLTIAANLLFQLMARDAIRRELDAEIAKAGGRANVDPVKVQQVEDEHMMIATMVYGAAIVLGVVFVVCGVLVNRFPVPVTILSLVLYVSATLGFAVLNPATLAPVGLIVKVLIIVFLAKAVQAALAYEKERQREAELGATG
jgi:hypothetical protein